MNLISYALWGTDPRYLVGALRNVDLARKFYPGWKLRFYCSDEPSVRVHLFTVVEHDGDVEVVRDCPHGDYRNLMSRLKGLLDTRYEYAMTRDADSRPNEREADAVREWIESGKRWHTMRDHRYHSVPIMGGLFGVRPRYAPWTQQSADAWLSKQASRPCPLGPWWGVDQDFLQQEVWPNVRHSILVHDDCKRLTGREIRFKKQLQPGLFVGQRYSADGVPEIL
jgi:hypothetical protein